MRVFAGKAWTPHQVDVNVEANITKALFSAKSLVAVAACENQGILREFGV